MYSPTEMAVLAFNDVERRHYNQPLYVLPKLRLSYGWFDWFARAKVSNTAFHHVIRWYEGGGLCGS